MDDDDADVDVVYVAVTLVVAETVVVGTTTGAGSMKFAGASKLVDVVDVETSMLK